MNLGKDESCDSIIDFLIRRLEGGKLFCECTEWSSDTFQIVLKYGEVLYIGTDEDGLVQVLLEVDFAHPLSPRKGKFTMRSDADVENRNKYLSVLYDLAKKQRKVSAKDQAKSLQELIPVVHKHALQFYPLRPVDTCMR